jgi:hypothetical protein
MKVQLVHSNAAEGKALAKRHGLLFEPVTPGALRKLCRQPVDAVVIDLSRAPSLGRDVALALRVRRTTRLLPLIFVEGDPAKVAAIRKLLPDASYGTWKRIRSLLRNAKPPAAPVVPASALAGYSGTPLPKKLGIKPGVRVGLLDEPRAAVKLLGDFEQAEPDDCDLLLWWVRSRADLLNRIREIRAPRLWIFWPKQSSGVQTDITQPFIRETGLSLGWVDYKVCAFDATWSGLLFRKRG